jgi:hypothetical protein
LNSCQNSEEFLPELRRVFCPQGPSRMNSFFGCHWRSWVAADLAHLVRI